MSPRTSMACRCLVVLLDKGRYKEAVKNFKRAGVGDLIDARLVDADRLVKELRGPFDLIFSDADKEW